MEIFPSLQKFFRLLGVFHRANGEYSNTFVRLVLLFYSLNTIGIFIFIFHRKLSIFELIFSISCTSELVFTPIAVILFMWERKTAEKLVKDLQNNIEKRRKISKRLMKVYDEAEEACVLLWNGVKLSIKFGFTSFVITDAMAFIFAAVFHKVSIGPQLFFHRTIFPWDQSTPISFLGGVTWDFFGCFAFMLSYNTFIPFFVAICIYISFCYDDIFQRAIEFDESVAEMNFHDASEILIDCVKFHVQITEFFSRSASILSSFFLLFFAQKSTMFAMFLFSVVVSYHTLTLLDVLVVCTGLPLFTSSLFFVCFMADIATASVAKVGNKFYETKWYNASVKQQKFIQMIITFSQKKQLFRGGGLITFDRKTFGNIVQKTVSYILLMKNLFIK